MRCQKLRDRLQHAFVVHVAVVRPGEDELKPCAQPASASRRARAGGVVGVGRELGVGDAQADGLHLAGGDGLAFHDLAADASRSIATDSARRTRTSRSGLRSIGRPSTSKTPGETSRDTSSADVDQPRPRAAPDRDVRVALQHGHVARRDDLDQLHVAGAQRRHARTVIGDDAEGHAREGRGGRRARPGCVPAPRVRPGRTAPGDSGRSRSPRGRC